MSMVNTTAQAADRIRFHFSAQRMTNENRMIQGSYGAIAGLKTYGTSASHWRRHSVRPFARAPSGVKDLAAEPDLVDHWKMRR
jgi:hypothetical protein